MPSSIDELDREITDLLHRKADRLELPDGRLEHTIHRSNRRLARNAVACLLAVGLVGSGTVAGIRSLAGPARTKPASTSPTPSAEPAVSVTRIRVNGPGGPDTFPLGLAGADGVVWVASGGNIGFPPMIGTLSDPSVDAGVATLARVRAGTAPPYEVTGQVTIGKAGDIGVVAAFGDAWVLRPALDRVIRIDGSSLAKLASIPVPHPSGAAADDSSLWVTSMDGTLTRIDPATNQVVASIDTGVPADRGFENDGALPPTSPNNGVPATGVAVGDGSVWVRGGGRLVRIDPATNSMQATIEVGGTIEGLAAGDSNVWISVCTPADPPCTWELVRIDATTNAIAGRSVLGQWETSSDDQRGDIGRVGVTLDSGSLVLSLAVNHGSEYARGRLLRIDPASGDVITSVEVPGSGGTTVGGREEKNTSDILGPVVIQGGAAWVINIESEEVVRLAAAGS
jgi:hypothetical protein